KRIRCPACADTMDVPLRAVLVPGAPPAREEAVRGGAPPVRSRSEKPPALPADEPAASPVHRHVGLWLGIAAVVPVAVVSVVFALYLLLSRTPDAVIADKVSDQEPAVQPAVQPVAPPAKVKVKA